MNKIVTKICVFLFFGYLTVFTAFYFIAGDQLHFQNSETEMPINAGPVGELTPETGIRQLFTAGGDEILGVQLLLSTYARQNTGSLEVTITDMQGQSRAAARLDMAALQDNALRYIVFDSPAKTVKGELLTLTVTSPDGAPGNAVTVWYGNSLPTARGQVGMSIPPAERIVVGKSPLEARLCFSAIEREYLWFGQYYWEFVGIGAVLLLGYCFHLLYSEKKGRRSLTLNLIRAMQRYAYLLRQLVSRDFKTKYTRSVLGVFWSFLNPLLTMLVQYIVFSTLFKSAIPNFALYLLIGIVCFNYFSEASSMSLQSIVGNASLITKVYMPKYIYPVSRVLSSTINLLLSLIPLAGVMLLTGTKIRPAILLLPFGLICLMMFCTGIGLLLSTAMVFFRDTQFLWGVLSMIWMYATPIFYPETIIPAAVMPLYKMNPLYHIIRFIRSILIDGVSPRPKAYLLCIVASFVPLLIGAVVFKKNQDKFILNL